MTLGQQSIGLNLSHNPRDIQGSGHLGLLLGPV